MLSKLRKTSYVNAAACLLVVAGLILAIVSTLSPVSPSRTRQALSLAP